MSDIAAIAVPPLPTRTDRGQKWPDHIWFVRHGQSAGNVARDDAESARATWIDIATRKASPGATALGIAARHDVAVVLKGATTWLAMRGRLWRHAGSNLALATSGSDDALAGIIGGVAARGASAEHAAAWGVALHAMAGARLVRRHGSLGVLGREIPHEIPAIMNSISRRAAA